MGLDLTTDDPRHRYASDEQRRKASVRVADQIAAEHPHPLDDVMPRLAGRQLAKDPAIADETRHLLDVLGLLPDEPKAKAS